MSDDTSPEFDRQKASDAFGNFPMCSVCGKKRATQLHHILKRGYDKGFRKDDPRRKMMSSLYGCCPICDDCHVKKPLHRYEGRLLRQTKHWLDTVHYKPNKIDIKFLDSFSHYYE